MIDKLLERPAAVIAVILGVFLLLCVVQLKYLQSELRAEKERCAAATAATASEATNQAREIERAALEARIAQLQRDQELSDQVTKDAAARIRAAEKRVEDYRAKQKATTDPGYAVWAGTLLPDSVAGRLRDAAGSTPRPDGDRGETGAGAGAASAVAANGGPGS